MSASSIDNGDANAMPEHLSTIPKPNDSVIEVGDETTSSSNPSTPRLITPTTETTWINTFLHCDRISSGSLLHISYRFIDIVLLLIGLLSTKSSCTLSDRLAVTSISLLVFYFIDLTIICFFFSRHLTSPQRNLSEEEKSEQLRRASALRGFFIFFKLIPVCLGTSYTFTSTISHSPDCELMRFCLGIVCLSTLLLMIIPPTRPDLPTRRSFIMECFILSFLLIINGTYLGTVASAMKTTDDASCIYQNSGDLYQGAPLKTYAYIGLILFGSTTIVHIINLLVTQLCHRLTNGRRFFVKYYAIQYLLNYFGALIVIYYLSIGALFLFQPRSGQPCRGNAPSLYRTLLIWQWIRVLSPLIAVPLLLILCCLGVFFGFILSYCLPASITVPLLDLIRVRENKKEESF
jgi:hypothetical protein